MRCRGGGRLTECACNRLHATRRQVPVCECGARYSYLLSGFPVKKKHHITAMGVGQHTTFMNAGVVLPPPIPHHKQTHFPQQIDPLLYLATKRPIAYKSAGGHKPYWATLGKQKKWRPEPRLVLAHAPCTHKLAPTHAHIFISSCCTCIAVREASPKHNPNWFIHG